VPGRVKHCRAGRNITLITITKGGLKEENKEREKERKKRWKRTLPLVWKAEK
jgi:hypothetical protein